VITGYADPDAGAVHFDGRPVTGMPPGRIFDAGLVRTFQTTRIFSRLTVRENLHVPWRNRSLRSAVRHWSPKGQQERVSELLEFVGLTALSERLAGELSYGQRKLLELASVLESDPRILLLDEPASGINPSLLVDLHTRIQLLNQRGLTVLMVEHDMEFVTTLSDTVLVMHQGRVMASGTPEQVVKDEAVLEAYLGVSVAL
jgi:branched-chain amino acid transport system ATP-binding protein